ncbi:recombinase family protein [Endozoicomonas lisbonensis]|uniref:recombinase family protein n=1 Tax=Endozoicomonas lisbonensis TaxID=3120522 RepID=UPI00339A3B08
MKFGYARVSTADQELDLQLTALEKAGCDEILAEKVSGRAGARPELDRLLDKLRPGDSVVIWRLDRLGRSMKHLMELVERFTSQEIELISLHENIDTTTATGKMMLQFFAMLAEFERNLISERTKAGLAAARARGKKGGRKPALDANQIRLARSMLSDPGVSVIEVAEHFQISRSALYRNLDKIS